MTDPDLLSAVKERLVVLLAWLCRVDPSRIKFISTRLKLRYRLCTSFKFDYSSKR